MRSPAARTPPAGTTGAAKPGWWDVLIGPGKAFDTESCTSSSRRMSSAAATARPARRRSSPSTGRPYGSRFPVVTIGDMVRVQRALVDRLGITRLRAVAGGSMGGMQALQWAVQYPDAVASVIALATSPRALAAADRLQRDRATGRDERPRTGAAAHYYGGEPPRSGLALARMLGHVTYLSDRGMERKFGRRRRPEARPCGFDTRVRGRSATSHTRAGRSWTASTRTRCST